jgi:hypothetical protein
VKRAKSRVILACAVLASLVSGCHTSYELATHRYQVTHNFSDAQVEIIRAEADKLCEATGGEQCIYVSREEHWNKITIGQTKPGVRGRITIEDDDTRMIVINPNIAENHWLLASVMRHELGHAAGCAGPVNNGHVASENSVMYYTHSDTELLSPEFQWTDDDIACILADEA